VGVSNIFLLNIQVQMMHTKLQIYMTQHKLTQEI